MSAEQSPFLRLVLGDAAPAPTPPSQPPPPPSTPSVQLAGRSSYATTALFREAERVRHAFEGERNHTLNTATFNLAQLIAVGQLHEEEVVAELTQAAREVGLHPKEITATIRSGLRGGKQHPRQLPDLAEDEPGVREVGLDALLPGAEPGGAIDQFWQARPVLEHIRTFAYARMTAPWAVLGGCLLRTVGAIAPHVVLPPIIGGVGSLNLLLSLVGPSGAGKGASEAAAADCLTWPRLHTAPLGSGEGITHAYARPRPKKKGDPDPDPDPLVWEHRSVLFTSPEIDQLAAIKDRRGSTLMAQLRSAYSGERLGMQYADATRRIILPAHQYRFGLSVGVQPDRARWLLDDADGGTPQRFIWLPVTDEHISANPPDEPDPYRWAAPLAVVEHIPGARRDTQGRVVLPIPDHVRSTIRQAHAARARGEGEALDGHALYTRLKVAVALAILEERLVMNDDDWALSGVVMSVSDVTRARIQARLSAQAEADAEARARREARQQEVVEETRAESAQQRVARGLSKRLAKAGTMTRAEARRSTTSRDRAWFDDALQRLVDAGQVKVSETESGEELQWVE